MKVRKIIFTTALSALVCFGLCQQVQSATDTPDPGSLPSSNTADGQGALNSLTTGLYNSAFGFLSVLSLSDGNFDTGVGAGALLVDNAGENTAVGAGALFSNTGGGNTAVGTFALFSNVGGGDNNAVGLNALLLSVSGDFDNAHGRGALESNVDGSENNAFGDLALESNTSGFGNSAFGDDALDSVSTGSENVGVGDEAGNSITTGSNNTCIGASAGIGIVDGSDIIAIGTPAAGVFANFGPTCFIGGINEPTGDPGSTVAVLIDSNNNLGTSPSSRRFKHDIKPMGKDSEALLALKPISFKYNYDVKGSTQYGLVAEEVAQVNPHLVVYRDGEPYTVRYDQINAMLLNEFLKEHKKVEEQQASMSQLKSEMQTMVAQLKEQAAQIQKVSAQLQVNKPAPQVVTNKP
jgi:(2Fe-2S) ferredoxin